MADLPLAGVRAVVDNLNGYVRDAEQMNRATAGIGNAAVKAANDSTKGAGGISQLGNAAANAGKNADGLGTHIGQLGQNIGGLILKLAPLAAGIAGAFAIGKGIEAVNELGATIFRLQKQTNLTAEQASQLKFAFEDSGVSIQTGERALIKFSRALGGVADLEDGIAIPTGKAMAKTLFDLGVRTEDAQGKTRPLTDVLGDLAEQFKIMPDGIDKTSLATNLFGRNGKDLIPFLNQGRDGLAALAAEAGELGLVLDQKTVDALRQNELATKRFHAALTGISVQIGLALLPALTVAVQVGTKLAVAFNQKITPAIRLVANVLVVEFNKFVRVVAPLMIRAFDAIGKSVTTFRNAFLIALVTGNITRQLSGLSLGFKVLGAVAGVLGAAFRASFEQIRQIILVLRVVGEIVRAVVSDFTNFNRILAFFPQPVQAVVHAIEDIIETITKATLRLIDWGRSLVAAGTPLNALGSRVGDLTAGPLGKFETILNRLATVVVPVLGGVITTFLGLLAVGTVLAFVSTIDALVGAFAAFGPVKVATQFLADFVRIASAPIRLVIDVVKGAVDKLFDAVTGIFGGGHVTQTVSQEVVNSPETEAKLHPQPVSQEINQIVTGKGGPPSITGEPAGKDAGKGFIGGFVDFITSALPNAVGNLLSGLALVLGTKLPGILAGAFGPEGIGTAIIGAAQTAGELIGAALATSAGIAAGAVFIAAIANIISYKLIGLRRTLANDFRTIGKGFGPAGELIGSVIALGIEGGIGKRIGAIGALIVSGLALGVGSLSKLNEGIHNFQHFMDTRLFPAASRIGEDAGNLIISGIGEALSGIGRFFTQFPPPHINVAAMLKNVTNDLQLWAYNTLLPAVGRIFVRLGDEIFHQTGAAFGRINAALGDPLGKAKGALEGFAGDIKASYFSTLHSINVSVGGALSEVGHTITDKLTTMSDTIDRIFGAIRQHVEDAWNAVARLTEGAWSTISGIVTRATGAVFDKVTTFADDVKRVFGTLAGAIGSAFDGVAATLGGVIDGIKLVVVGGFTLIRDGVVGIIRGISGAVGDVFGGVGDIITSGLRGLAGIVADALSLIEPVISKIDDIIQTDYAGPVRAAIDALRGLATSARPGFGGGGGPPAGQPVLPGLPGSGTPVFAAGSGGPLLAPTKAIVADAGRELVLPSLISRPKLVNLPSGAVVLSHSETESVLRSLMPRGGSAGTEHDFMVSRTAQGAAGLANGTLTRILSTLQSLPQRGATISGDTLVNVPIDVDARGLDWEAIRIRLHQEIDRQFISSRSRATRAGSPISGGLG